MKRTILLSIAVIAFGAFTRAQTHSMHVSLQGGAHKMLLLGKRGYNAYYFSNVSPVSDTLTCTGKGWEQCKVDREVIRDAGAQEADYKLFNKGIRIARKEIRRSATTTGEFTKVIDGRSVYVAYRKTGGKNDMDFEMQLR